MAANGAALKETPEVDTRRATGSWRHTRRVRRRLGWGVADQAVSSLTNFAVNIYIVRYLGAVQYGAFALAYVTYSFVLQASRGLATDPLLVRFSGTDVPTWRRAVSSSSGTATLTGLVGGVLVARGGRLSERPDQNGFPRARIDPTGSHAAGQLAIRVLRARARQSSAPERHCLGGMSRHRPGVPPIRRTRQRVLVCLRLGRGSGGGGGGRRAADQGRTKGVSRPRVVVAPARSRDFAISSKVPLTVRQVSCVTTESASFWDWLRLATFRRPAH